LAETVWILGDQLLAGHPGLAVGRRVLLIESLQRLRLRPYHRHKLVLVLSAMRHYAEELRAAGYTVDLRQAPNFLSGLREHIREYNSVHLTCMAAAEYDTRQFQAGLADALGIAVDVLPNNQFLLERIPLKRSPKRMETFYRDMRRQTGLLMEVDGEPAGGRWNFDSENRKSYDGRPVPPLPSFAPDAITSQVISELDELCPAAPGKHADFALAVSREQAQAALDDFIAHRLADFGPFEDAMSRRHAVLFHSQLSPLLNLGLLEPLPMCEAAEAAYRQGRASLASVEGFVRQIIGWREYMYLRYWELMPDLREANAWQHERVLPAFYYSGETAMNCMRHAIGRVLAQGYSHHIERLMLLCNFALLAGIRPGEVNDWFLELYIDAYDWVVTPNVIGMGLNADGGTIATKPYIASANYIHKMSDYCGDCGYNRRSRSADDACPFNTLYWNFLLEHESRLRSNPRTGPAVLGLRHLDEQERAAVRRRAGKILENLDTL
jgi:deoxyribodipyrimidine photolyase-related protein